MGSEPAKLEYRAGVPVARVALAPGTKLLRWAGGISVMLLAAAGLADRPRENISPELVIIPLVLVPLAVRSLLYIRRTRQRGVLACVFSLLVAAAAICAAFVVGTRESPHERAGREYCLFELYGIGRGMSAYVAAHGEWPQSLNALAAAQPAGSELELVCVSSPEAEPRTYQSRTDATRTPSYFYLRPAAPSPVPAVVVAFERPNHFRGRGVNVLMSDGRAIPLMDAEAMAVLAELAAGQNPPKLLAKAAGTVSATMPAMPTTGGPSGR